MMKQNTLHTEADYTHTLYRNIICLGMLLHSTYILIFLMLGIDLACLYNIISVLFYGTVLLFVSRKQVYAYAVTLIHMEVSLFVIVHTWMFGWSAGYGMFLVAMASLVYFCPYRHTYIPYLFSLWYACAYFLLYFLGGAGLHLLASSEEQILFCVNNFSAFMVILYVAYASKVSAKVGLHVLMNKNKDLQQIANYDQLTGLYSRHYLKERYHELVMDQTIIAIGDIDDFKRINDTFGHICGDAVLRQLADVIRRLLDPNVCVCRWGGEEFLFVFSNVQFKEAREGLEELREQIAREVFQFNGHEFHITMTFGISEHQGCATLNDWIHFADALLYQGKQEGKNKVLCAKPEHIG